jgi:hypothetical protein
MRVVVFVAVFATCLVATPAFSGQVMTADWFAAHPQVMRDLLKICHNNPGQVRNNANCVNAEQAEDRVSADDWLARFMPKGH